MRDYLERHVLCLLDPDARIKAAALLVGLIGPLLANFLLRPAVGTVLILWACDFFFGTRNAIAKKAWKPRRAFWSGLKLAMYLALLSFGCLLQWGLGGYVGAGIFAAFASAVILTEATSVLSHAAELCPEEAGPVRGLLLSLASISRNAQHFAPDVSPVASSPSLVREIP